MKPLDTLRLTAFLITSFFVIGWVMMNSCNSPAIAESKRIIPYETCDTNFYNGQILAPDYVHCDTLVVTDAAFLNKCMAEYDIASDGDIMDILSVTTKKLHEN